MSSPSISCRDFVASIGEYQSGEMAPRRWTLFAGHLSQCDKCAAYLKSYAATVTLATDAHPDEGDDTPDELVRSIMASHRKRRSR
jgi:hypothetical protein